MTLGFDSQASLGVCMRNWPIGSQFGLLAYKGLLIRVAAGHHCTTLTPLIVIGTGLRLCEGSHHLGCTMRYGAPNIDFEDPRKLSTRKPRDFSKCRISVSFWDVAAQRQV